VSSAVGKEFLTADKGKTFKEGGTMKKMNPGMMAMMAKKKPMAKKEMSAEMPMKKGGMAKKPVKKMMGGGMGYAKGGGIEVKGKTKGTMIKMKSGGKAC